MDTKPIWTTRDYEMAIKAIEQLMAAKRNAAGGDRLAVLVTLVEAYEARHSPLERHRHDLITTRLNEIYGSGGVESSLDRDLATMQSRSLRRRRW